MTRPLTILCAAKLHANQLERHLEVLERCPSVGRIIVVRHAPLPHRLSKLENVGFAPGNLPVSVWRMHGAITGLLERERVDWVVGFNPVPWGSIALSAAAGRVPVCLGLIGKDYQQIHEPWGLPFRRALARADAITVTGELMREGLERLGVSKARTHVLPHSVDLERFAPVDQAPNLDIVSVGQLIRRKRMDVLIEALAIARRRGLRLTLGILGRGPEEARLRRQVERSGLEDAVTFLGYRDDVETVVARARSFALVSEWEGVPFALMEAMACAVVPVVTPAGTISDWVDDGRNGLLTPIGDAVALAERLTALLGPDRRMHAALRARLVEERARLSFDSGVAVWSTILSPSPPRT